MLKVDESYDIFPRIVVNNAQANGSEKNKVDFYFYESLSGDAAVGLSVTIRVTGNANISEGSGPQYNTVTDGTGKASVSIIDDTVETVEVLGFVRADPTQKATVSVTFEKVSKGFRITEAVNKNKTFDYGHPTLAWRNASFTLHTAGGNGNITWEVIHATQEVSISPNDRERSAGVTITANPNTPCTIRATDSISGETDEYVFSIKRFVKAENDKAVTLSDAQHAHGKNLLTQFEYHDLFTEWGDLTVYDDEWIGDKDYWTSTSNGLNATIADIKNGTFRVTAHGPWDKYYYAFNQGE